MRSSDYIKVRLFETAYRESNGKAGLFGEVIAWCLANRVRRNMGTWTEVLSNVPRYQANEPDPMPEFPNLWEPNVQRLLQAVDAIYENSGNDLSNGGLYYCFTARGVNDWFRSAVIDGDYSVVATQIDLKVWGEKSYVGKPYDPRIAMSR